MDEVERVKNFILWQRLLGRRCILLGVDDFPCLRYYALRIEHLPSETFLLGQPRQRCKAIPYWTIRKYDPFWKKVFPNVGFAFILSWKCFYFENNEDYQKPEEKYGWKIALRFIEELERRGFLDEKIFEEEKEDRNTKST